MKKFTALLSIITQLLPTLALAGQTSERNLKADLIEGMAASKNFVANSGFEKNTRGWSTFDDGAVSLPVDMTGGAPAQVTVARTNTAGENLNGAYSLEITKAAADAQGEGLSYTVSIPEGYRGTQLAIAFPFKVNSGSITSGDLKVFAYDVTNSAVLTPINNDVVGSNGIILGLFSTLPSTASLRIGLMFASTSTTAATISIDDVQLYATREAIGGITTDWESYTVTITGTTTNPSKGTPTVDKAWWRRVGDSMEIHYQLNTATGSAGSGTYLFSIPSGYTIDGNKIEINTSDLTKGACGFGIIGNDNTVGPTVSRAAVKVYNTTNFVVARQITDIGTNAFLSSTSGITLGGSFFLSVQLRVPIVGWSSNVTLTSSSTIKISHYLANGTRVTGSAPDALGEYRSYLRDASANTYTETNGSPTATPSVANGIRIYNGNAYNAADTNNEPTRYDIFIGKNKYFRMEWYKSAARTGYIDTSPFTFTNDYGYGHSYDPTTGVLSVWGNRVSGGTTTHTSGVDEANTASNDPYFDVIVSENSLAVGVQAPRSEVNVYGGNGNGSTNTRIKRFSTTETNIGTAITYADSATNGASFTINETGVYCMTYVDGVTAGNGYLGISKNSSQLTTNIQSITEADKLMVCVEGFAEPYFYMPCSVCSNLSAGDVVRPHTDQFLNGNDNNIRFRIVKVSN